MMAGRVPPPQHFVHILVLGSSSVHTQRGMLRASIPVPLTASSPYVLFPLKQKQKQKLKQTSFASTSTLSRFL
jgi:hypothetical protein